MALLGKGAMTLWFDIEGCEPAAHDHWHTHEHLVERLSIPGFLRGSRWVASNGSPRYFVLYEVADIGVLQSDAYLDRLNHPSAWTTKMMPHYRGMTRGLCRVVASRGAGMGRCALTLRFSPAPGKAQHLDTWISGALLPLLAAKPGICGAHLLESALTAALTREQEIRGRDQPVDRVLFVTAYAEDALTALQGAELRVEALHAQGMAPGFRAHRSGIGACLTAAEVDPA
jgi:hypothetical protein